MGKKILIMLTIYFSIVFFVFGLKIFNDIQSEKIFDEIRSIIDFDSRVLWGAMTGPHKNYIKQFNSFPKLKRLAEKYLKKNPDNLENNYFLFREGLFEDGRSRKEQIKYFFSEGLKRKEYDILTNLYSNSKTQELERMAKKYLKKNPDDFKNNYFLFRKGLFEDGRSKEEQNYYFFSEAIKRKENEIAKECFDRIPVYMTKLNFCFIDNNKDADLKSIDYIKKNFDTGKSDLDRYCRSAFDYYRFIKTTAVINHFGRGVTYFFINKNIYEILINGKVEVIKNLMKIADIYNKYSFDFKKNFDFKLYFDNYYSALKSVSKRLDKRSKEYLLIIEELKKYENYKIENIQKLIKKPENKKLKPFFLHEQSFDIT